ncbi:MAG: carboxyl-terminal processing protease, partial [Gemmatimonadaceae bacterium]|nr:carboxyl-terminal processing protease [Gemmatimonadaceae bacterium]
QSVVSFGDQGGLKLTTARWFTPAGRSITRARPNEDDTDDPSPVKRERFRTDAGRVVYGGGGITPDVIAGDSVIPIPEGNFIHALGANGGHFRDAVTDYALYVKATHGVASPDFVVTSAMRDEVWNRMKQRGIDIPRSVFDEGEPLVTRLIGYDIARYVFGSEAEFRRRASVDKALQRALQMARGSRSESDLLRKATALEQPADSTASQ